MAAPVPARPPVRSASGRSILLFGSNERAGLQMCRSLGRAGHRVTVLRLSPGRTPADHSRYCAESLYVGMPEAGAREYCGRVADVLAARRYDYLIPVDEVSTALTYFAFDAVAPLTRVIGPTPASYTVARDRFAASALAEGAGLERPASFLVRRGATPPPWPLPCVVKPVCSCAVIDDELQSFSIRTVTTAAELDAKLRDDLPRIDVMLQSPLGSPSLMLNCCAVDGTLLGATVTVSVREGEPGNGDSYSKSEEACQPQVAVMEKIARDLSWTGFMTVVCKRTPDGLVFVELESWPSHSLSLSWFAGVDLPRLLVDGIEGRRSARLAQSARTVYTRHLRRDIHWLVTRLARPGRPRAMVGWLVSCARLLAGRERLEVERLADLWPAVRQLDGPVRAFVAKIRLSAAKRPRRARLAPGLLDGTSSLLIVCRGNINRSAVAEHLLRARGFSRARSAGLIDMSGRRLSAPAEAFLMERLGIDGRELRSRSITRALKESGDVDMVLCFERSHVAEIGRRFPKLRGRVFLLTALAGDHRGPPDIADPYGAAPAAYLTCFRRIEELVEAIARRCQRASSSTRWPAMDAGGRGAPGT